MANNVSLIGKTVDNPGILPTDNPATRPLFLDSGVGAANAAGMSALGKGNAGDTTKQILDADKMIQAIQAIKKASQGGGMMGGGKGGDTGAGMGTGDVAPGAGIMGGFA